MDNIPIRQRPFDAVVCSLRDEYATLRARLDALCVECARRTGACVRPSQYEPLFQAAGLFDAWQKYLVDGEQLLAKYGLEVYFSDFGVDETLDVIRWLVKACAPEAST